MVNTQTTHLNLTKPEEGIHEWADDMNTNLDTLDTNVHETSTALTSHVGSNTQHGATGGVVGTTNTQTLTNKTLTKPTITDMTNATHTHKANASGGTIAHTDLTAIGVNTHATIDTHISSVANPHTVTKTQVGLSAVTNDSQLKRSAGDLNSFSAKAVPVNADILIVEDSENIFNKKKILIGSLPLPPSGVTGAASSVGGNIVLFDGETGKLIKDGGKGLSVGAIVGTTDTQTLTNKTITSPKLNENVALTSTSTELNYVKGVTSAIQSQFSGKAPNAHASTATTYGVSSASNYGHAMASSVSPKAAGTAALGTEETKFARGDHVHPVQTSVSGSSGSCTGNAATSSSCTGNALTSSSCTGNALTSSSCTGNALTSSSCTGNAASASAVAWGNVSGKPSTFVPSGHASTATTYGVSSATNYGHAMASSTSPKAAGTANIGTETAKFAMGDHVHPAQTSVSGSSGSCTGNALTSSSCTGNALTSSSCSGASTSCSGNAATATKLATTRTIGISGGATGTPTNFNGSGNITIPITALDANLISGVIPLICMPPAALAKIVIVANDVARFALTTASANTGDTVKVTSTGLMYFVKDGTKLNVEEGYEVYVAGAASTIPWVGITGKPTTFTPSGHASTATTYGVSSASNYGHAMASSVSPKAAGTAALGTEETKFARGDHVHPAQTSVSGSSGSCTGNALTSSSCSGNAATSSSCTGNALTSSSCTGNALTSSSCTGNAASASEVAWGNVSSKPSTFTPSAHATAATTYGVSSATNYGHAMASSTSPKAAGTANIGTETAKFAMGDHVHPAQTSVSGSSGSCTGNALTSSSCTGNAASATTAGTCSGTAAKATILATTRTFSLTGDVTGSATFNGSGNCAIATSYAGGAVVAVPSKNSKFSVTENANKTISKNTWTQIKGWKLSTGFVGSGNGFLVSVRAKSLSGDGGTIIELRAGGVVIDKIQYPVIDGLSPVEHPYVPGTYYTMTGYALAMAANDVISIHAYTTNATGDRIDMDTFVISADYVTQVAGTSSGTFTAV